jgi:hypothetical protein
MSKYQVTTAVPFEDLFTGIKGNPELSYKDKKGNDVKVSAYDAAHYPESHPAYQAYIVRFMEEKFAK